MPNHPLNPNIRLLDGNFYADNPHPHFRWMRENAPVYWDPAGNCWGITRFEDLTYVGKTPRLFSNSGGIRPDAPSFPYMINLDNPQHHRRRSLVSKGFTNRAVGEREARIRQVSVDLIEKAKRKGEFDFVADVAAWLPLILIGDMLGVDPADYDSLLRWSDDMVLGTGATTLDRIDAASRAFEEYCDYQRRVIADRRSRPPQSDLVSILVHADIDGEKLDDEEILWESLLILIGGDETTRHVISGGMYELLRHPEQMRLLVAHPEKIPVAVEEMLRWVSPIQNMMRTALQDVELNGERIRAGDKLLLLYPSANRDAAAFPEPDRFDVERDPNPHVAFGFGVHYCLGANLARLELNVMFQEIVRRMPALQLASDAEPPRRASNFITGIERLPVVWHG